MTRFNRRLIIVVTAAVAAIANAHAKELDIAGGEHTFTVGLSANGNAPATHYWCSWQMTDEWDAAIKQKLAQAVQAGNAWVFNGNVRVPSSILTELGLQRVEQPQ